MMMISSYGHGSILLAFRTALFAALTGKWTSKRDDDGKKKMAKAKNSHVCVSRVSQLVRKCTIHKLLYLE